MECVRTDVLHCEYAVSAAQLQGATHHGLMLLVFRKSWRYAMALTDISHGLR